MLGSFVSCHLAVTAKMEGRMIDFNKESIFVIGSLKLICQEWQVGYGVHFYLQPGINPAVF